MKTKQERIEAVNQIMSEIAKRGRQFFYRKDTDTVAYFYLSGEKQKRLWFFDKRGGKVNPYPSNSHRDDHFSEGGTLWGLMQDFSEFIRTGKYSNGKNGYGGLYCSHWGYPEEDMIAIRKLAMEVGFLKTN